MKKRSKATKNKVKAAVAITLASPSKEERVVAGARNRYLKILKAQKSYDDYIAKQVMDGIINTYNDQVDPALHIENIQLFSQGKDLGKGEYKLSVQRQIKRHMDGRADMARNLVEQWMKDFEASSTNFPDSDIVYEMLKRVFFSTKGFKWTPQLYQFLLLPEDRIHDDRLKKAQKLLKESVQIDKSQWYAHVFRYDEKTKEYEKLCTNDLE